MLDPVLQENTREYKLRKTKFQIWEEFDEFVENFIDKHELDKELRLDLFRVLKVCVDKKLYPNSSITHHKLV